MSQKRVLVVDDDAAIRQMFMTLLQRNGYDVDQAHDGKEGLSYVRDGDYAAIILDLMTMIARVLHLSPHDLLGEDEEVDGFLADKIATLKPNDRARFWHDLTGSRKRNGNGSSRRVEDLSVEVEELLAQIDFLRGEV